MHLISLRQSPPRIFKFFDDALYTNHVNYDFYFHYERAENGF